MTNVDFARFEMAWDEEDIRVHRSIRSRILRFISRVCKRNKRKDDPMIWISPEQVMTRNGNVLRLDCSQNGGNCTQ